MSISSTKRTEHDPAYKPTLLDLQRAPHRTDCASRRIGSTDWPHCSCGLTAALLLAGDHTRR